MFSILFLFLVLQLYGKGCGVVLFIFSRYFIYIFLFLVLFDIRIFEYMYDVDFCMSVKEVPKDNLLKLIFSPYRPANCL